MTRATIIRLLESELVKPDLSADLRLKYASEIAILRGWQATQGRVIASNLPTKSGRGTRKVVVWDRWLRERCPAEYRPQHPAITMPFGIEDYIVSYIKKVCRCRWSLSHLDAAFQYALEQVQQSQAEQQQAQGETKS
jgi:hypothetical protein